MSIIEGVTQRGAGVQRGSGADYYVDRTNGSNNNDGFAWSRAKATIQAGLNLCTSGNGDHVWVAPGTYPENVILTAKHNVHLMASPVHGNSKRVAIAPASGIAFDLAQCNRFVAYGIRFVGTSAVGCRSDGEGALFEYCDFTSDTSHGLQFLGATDTDYTGSGTELRRCLFRECGGAGIRLSKGTGVCLGLQATNVNVLGCQFYLNTGDDIDDDAGSESPTYFYQWEITENRFMTRNKAVYLDMDGGVSTECLIAGNYFADDAGLNATKIALATGAVFAGNFQAAGVVDGSTF